MLLVVILINLKYICRWLTGGKLLSFVCPKESNQRKGHPIICRYRGSLDAHLKQRYTNSRTNPVRSDNVPLHLL